MWFHQNTCLPGKDEKKIYQFSVGKFNIGENVILCVRNCYIPGLCILLDVTVKFHQLTNMSVKPYLMYQPGDVFANATSNTGKSYYLSSIFDYKIYRKISFQ